jgi:hypothetical protein
MPFGGNLEIQEELLEISSLEQQHSIEAWHIFDQGRVQVQVWFTACRCLCRALIQDLSKPTWGWLQSPHMDQTRSYGTSSNGDQTKGGELIANHSVETSMKTGTIFDAFLCLLSQCSPSTRCAYADMGTFRRHDESAGRSTQFALMCRHSTSRTTFSTFAVEREGSTASTTIF